MDDTDRDGAQFWTGVIAALETLTPGRGERATALLTHPGAILEVVGVLLDDLDVEGQSAAVLVVDDFHLLDDSEVTAMSLALFVQYLPPWLHVVLLARRTPNLPIDRLRARGHLSEIHFAELKFSLEEAMDILSRLAPSLSEDQVTVVSTQAGGWAAGIQLAALAARSARAQSVTAPHGEGDLLVEDYVWHEVLAAESPDLVDALLDTAVVERASPSLARALTGSEDAGDLLARAEARGLFVSRLAPAGWFEMHSLVRKVLISELARRSPTRVAEQHVRAARWFEEAGEVPAALTHWLLAARPRDALRLLAAENAALYDSGREATIARTIGEIPQSVATADLEAMLEFAWCHLLVSRNQFLETTDQLTEWASHSADVDPTLRGRMTMLQSVAATICGDWAEGRTLARQAMLDLGEASSFDYLGRFGWDMIAREIALSERWEGSGADVREVRLSVSREPERRLAFEGTRALGEALAGSPVDALRVAAGVRRSAEVTSMTVLRAELSAAEAIAHRELGDLPRANTEFLSLAEVRIEPVTYCQVLAFLELTQMRLDDGDLEAAERMFGQAAELVTTELPGSGGRGWLARVGTRLSLAAGEIDGARRWCEQIDDHFWGGVSAARVDLAEGNRADAITALEAVEPRCVRHEVIRELLRARAFEQHEESVKCVATAIEQAVAHGLLQTVASEGPDILGLVELAAWRTPQAWLDRLRRAAAHARGPTYLAHRAAEALTDRERDVLRMLPSRLTLREIAGELYISVNTLKFHLKVIYRKLGCSSRAEAAEVARAMTTVRRPGQAPNTLSR
ncbi:MAG: LuxR C-terminal-related transcriptional regulator [Jiangellaceae bacterium]